MVGHWGSSAGSYLADPISPIPSHCASIVATSTVRVNNYSYDLQTLTIKDVKQQTKKEFYIIVLEDELQAGDNIKVYMEFEGPLKNDRKGMYWSSYKDDNNVTQYVINANIVTMRVGMATM